MVFSDICTRWNWCLHFFFALTDVFLYSILQTEKKRSKRKNKQCFFRVILLPIYNNYYYLFPRYVFSCLFVFCSSSLLYVEFFYEYILVMIVSTKLITTEINRCRQCSLCSFGKDTFCLCLENDQSSDQFCCRTKFSLGIRPAGIVKH